MDDGFLLVLWYVCVCLGFELVFVVLVLCLFVCVRCVVLVV